MPITAHRSVPTAADMAAATSRTSARASAPVLMYPEKFELALRYGEEVLMADDGPKLNDGDKLLLDALAKQERTCMHRASLDMHHTCCML